MQLEKFISADAHFSAEAIKMATTSTSSPATSMALTIVAANTNTNTNVYTDNQYEENVEHLRKLFNNSNLVSFNIMHIKCCAGSSSGDNYMSVVKRVSLYERTPEGNELGASKSVIIKRQLASISRRQLYRCEEAFTNEINAYKYVVPLLRRYSNQPLFPFCYMADTNDQGPTGEPIIVLDDLKALGYSMQNRIMGLELRHCILVMKKLAKLHAASLAARQLETQQFEAQCQHIREIVYCNEAADFYSKILDTSFEQALESLHASNVDGRLTVPITLIEQIRPHLFGQIQRSIVRGGLGELSVMCHGDLWVNNIMFTDDAASPPSTTPNEIAAIFFDLQAMRLTSPVFDILHFVYTSTRRKLRDMHMQTLLTIYAEALEQNLDIQLRNTHAADKLESLRSTFSLQRLCTEYERNVKYGLAICMWIMPAVTFDPDNIPNLDVISELNTLPKEIKCTHKLTPEYHLRIKELALEFYEQGYLLTNYEDDDDNASNKECSNDCY